MEVIHLAFELALFLLFLLFTMPEVRGDQDHKRHWSLPILTSSIPRTGAIVFYSSLLCRLRVDLFVSVTSILRRKWSLNHLDLSLYFRKAEIGRNR